MRIPLVGQSYTSRSIAAAAQRTINVYPEAADDAANQRSLLEPSQRGKNPAFFYGCPGHHLLVNLTTIDAAATPLRAVWGGGGRLFVVAGTKYFEVDQAGALVGSVHTIASDSNPAVILPNGNQLLIISGGLVYCDSGAGPVACTFSASAGTVSTVGTAVTWVSGDKFVTDGTWVGTTFTINAVAYTIASVTDSEHLVLTGTAGTQTAVTHAHTGAAVTAVDGAYLDTYFIIQRPAGGSPDLGRQFNLSAPLDGSTWDALDFAQKESYPDYLRSIQADNEQLYLWGTETNEIWQGTGGGLDAFGVARFPFERINGAASKFGNVSTWGKASLDGKVYFLGGNSRGQVSAYVLDGFSPRRISTHAAEAQWNKAALGRNAVSYAYQEEGHSFWVINFGSQTWAYDPGTNLWHERYAWTGSAFAAYRTRFHTFIPEWGSAGKHITGGLDGKLFEASVNFYDDAGADLAWQRDLPYLYNAGMWQYFGRLELEMETGAVASGAAPVVTFSYSDNRGKTFTNPRTAAIGAHDETSTRVYINRNGKSRGRIWRLAGIGQSKVALVDLNGDVTLGTT